MVCIGVPTFRGAVGLLILLPLVIIGSATRGLGRPTPFDRSLRERVVLLASFIGLALLSYSATDAKVPAQPLATGLVAASLFVFVGLAKQRRNLSTRVLELEREPERKASTSDAEA